MGKKLHLGCFDQSIEGWVNTDITPHIWIARFPLAPAILRAARLLNQQRYLQHSQGVFGKLRYLNVAKRFPFPNDSFQAVFSSHMLEHLTPMVADNCVRESLRVLCPGGVCRIAVPDLDALISSYDPENPDNFVSAVFECGHGLEKNSHHWSYNGRSLCRLLRRVGFAEASVVAYRVGRCPDLDRIDNRPGSLFVEGVKAPATH